MKPLTLPLTDPTPLFEHFRGAYATELLTAAIELDVFSSLANEPLSGEALGNRLGLASRPVTVLTTALKAMGLLAEQARLLRLTPLAHEHLLPGGEFYIGDYIGLAAASPGVREMVVRLKTNRPAGAEDEQGAAFIFGVGVESAMEREVTARRFTLALAGRANNVAPVLAEKLPLDGVRCLLDIGGGTGIYSIALLRQHPQLRAIVLDGPQVLKVTQEFAREYGVADRLSYVAGDMFADALPTNCEAILLSNILHDWDAPQCRLLVQKCAAALPSEGRLLIHDVFLNDALDGPLPIALYSAALFTLTEGRAYSAGEYRDWLTAAGLQPQPIIPTLVHCGVLIGVKP
jgi:predicted O-methyltransferase YrrM